jgi:hypothetical protein
MEVCVYIIEAGIWQLVAEEPAAWAVLLSIHKIYT